MIFEGEFLSGGQLRWNLGWPTPNYAGAFLATLLALTFAFSSSRWRWWALGLEVVGFFLLAKTYSRGAVVAWCAAWGFGFLAARGWNESAERLVWVVRMVILAVVMFAVGFGWNRAGANGTSSSASDGPTGKIATSIKRSSQALAKEDRSVVNRLALWRGGLKMIAAAPLTGWGAGESGRAYMNWFQDIERTEGYATMVNSYLHVAVEHGLPVLAVVLFGLAWLLAAAWRGAHTESSSPASRFLQVAAGASLVGWAAANVFTTLWIEPRLWIVPAVACLVLGWEAWKNQGIRFISLAVASLLSAVIVTGSLYGAGRWLLRSEPRSITPGANGSVTVGLTEAVGGVCHVWPDSKVLGPTPGKELHRWLASGKKNIRLVVHRAAPLQAGEVSGEVSGAMFFGRQAERFGPDFLLDCRELWLIHPLGAPPLVQSGTKREMAVTLLLPEIDELGNGPAWRNWAAKAGARVIVSTTTGVDIRSVWPGQLETAINENER